MIFNINVNKMYNLIYLQNFVNKQSFNSVNIINIQINVMGINTANLKEILALPSIYTHFNTLKKKSLRKTLWKKVKLLIMSNFTIFHNVFYTICI